jgi:hypothetical protein
MIATTVFVQLILHVQRSKRGVAVSCTEIGVVLDINGYYDHRIGKVGMVCEQF